MRASVGVVAACLAAAVGLARAEPPALTDLKVVRKDAGYVASCRLAGWLTKGPQNGTFHLRQCVEKHVSHSNCIGQCLQRLIVVTHLMAQILIPNVRGTHHPVTFRSVVAQFHMQ